MITFTGGTARISDATKRSYPTTVSLVFDTMLRADGSVVVILFVKDSDEIIDTFETAYSASTVNAETTTETTYTTKLNQAIHLLEKARLEAANGSITFTITL